MRQRAQQRSENLSTTFIETAKRAKHKGGMIVLVFVILNLVCRVAANFPCKPEQIHWNNTKDRRYKCLECPDCPAGSQPSVACGSSVKYGTHVDCVLCELGKTFSDKYDNAQCMSCTICPKGKAVTSNCTLTTNTNCDNKCGYGFYTVPLISSCLPCTQCCGDEKDELATECVNHKKKCKVRYTPCIPLHKTQKTPSKPSEKHNTFYISPTTETVTSQSYTKTMPDNKEKNQESDQTSIRIIPTQTWPAKQDGTEIVMILFMVIIALCVVMSVLVTSKKLIRVGDLLRSFKEQFTSNNEGNATSQDRAQPRLHSSASYQPSQESASPLLSRSESLPPNGSGSPQLNNSTSSDLVRSVPLQSNEDASSQANESVSSPVVAPSSCQFEGPVLPQSNESQLAQSSGPALIQYGRSSQEQDKANPGDVTLEELEEKHFPVFERMCKELNSRIPGERWDFERLASCYGRISVADRNCLKNEFQNDGGSPSDILMSHIKAKYPGHPLRRLVRNLQSIGRNDVAGRLMPYLTQKPSST